jgi:hypothetical protein
MEYYLVIKKNEILSFARKSPEIQDIRLRDISQL